MNRETFPRTLGLPVDAAVGIDVLPAFVWTTSDKTQLDQQARTLSEKAHNGDRGDVVIVVVPQGSGETFAKSLGRQLGIGAVECPECGATAGHAAECPIGLGLR